MPGTHDITIYQGSTWRAAMQWTDASNNAKNLTNWVFRMQVRRKYADEDTEGPYVDIDNALKGGITLTPLEGLIAIEIDATATEAMTKGAYVYDIEYDDADGVTDKLLRGKATLVLEVTRV